MADEQSLPPEGTPEWKLFLWARQQGWADTDLARESGIAKSTISKWRNDIKDAEQENNRMTEKMAIRLCKATGIDMLDLRDPDCREIPSFQERGVKLTDDQKKILWLAEELGFEDAKQRLLAKKTAATEPDEGIPGEFRPIAKIDRKSNQNADPENQSRPDRRR